MEQENGQQPRASARPSAPRPLGGRASQAGSAGTEGRTPTEQPGLDPTRAARRELAPPRSSAQWAREAGGCGGGCGGPGPERVWVLGERLQLPGDLVRTGLRACGQPCEQLSM